MRPSPFLLWDCRKSLSLRASARREASALGVLLGMTGVRFIDTLEAKKNRPCGRFFLLWGIYSALGASAAALAAAAFFSAAAFCAALNFSFSSAVGMGSMALRGQALAHMVQFLHLL